MNGQDELLKAIFDRLEITENNLKAEIKELKSFNESLVEKYNRVEKIVVEQKMTILELQKQINRKNIIIHGIPPGENENELEQKIVETLNEKLHMKLTEDRIEQVYRLGKGDGKKELPIKVEFVSFKDKMSVIKNRMMLKGSKIYINNELPRELRIKEMEERKARRERFETHNNRKQLREQSSEEGDNRGEKIEQQPKRLREYGRAYYGERIQNLELSQKNII